MENKEIKKVLNIDIELIDYIDKNGKSNIISDDTIEHLINSLKRDINNANDGNKSICERSDRIYDFENFPVDIVILKNYNDDIIEIYQHFVYEFCRKYYYNQEFVKGYRHGMGYQEKVTITNYDKASDLHLNLINYKEENKPHYSALNRAKEIDKEIRKEGSHRRQFSHHIPSRILTIKERIDIFLGVAMEFNYDYSGTNHLVNVNKDNFNDFVDFIIDSKMFTFKDIVCNIYRPTIKRSFSYNKVLQPKITVALALINLCYSIDYEEGLDYLNEKGMNDNDLKSHGGFSWIITFLHLHFNGREWSHFLEFNEINKKVKKTVDDKKFLDKVDIEVINELDKYLLWVKILTSRYNKLPITIVGDKNGGDNYIMTLPSNQLKTYINKTIYGLDDNQLDIIVNLILKNINTKFMKYNHIEDNEIDKVVNHIFNHIKKSKIKTLSIKNNNIGHDYNISIKSILHGGVINEYGNVTRKYGDYSMSINRCRITNTISNYEFNKHEEFKNLDLSKNYLILDNEYETSDKYIRTETSIKHIIDLDTFVDDYNAITLIVDKWSSGKNLNNNDIKLCYDSERLQLLKEIAKREKEICELKGQAGLDC